MHKTFNVDNHTKIVDATLPSQISAVLGIVSSHPAVCSAKLMDGVLIIDIVPLPGLSMPETVTVQLE